MPRGNRAAHEHIAPIRQRNTCLRTPQRTPRASAARPTRFTEEEDGKERVKSIHGPPVLLNNEKRPIWDELYVELVRMPLTQAAAWLTALTGVTVVVFTFIYALHPSGFTPREDDKMAADYFDIFLFSLSTTTTLGISPTEPQSRFNLLVANFHAIAVQMLLVFVTGVFFTRLSQTNPAVKSSKFCCIGKFNGRQAVRARFVYQTLRDVLIDVRFSMTYQHLVKLPSGEMFYKYDNLELMRSEAVRSLVGGTLIHFIDEKSPLYKKTVEDLDMENAIIQISIFGSEEKSMQPAHFIHDFKAREGHVVENVKYCDMVSRQEDGRVIMDHAKLDMLKPESPDTTPKQVAEPVTTAADPANARTSSKKED